MTTSAGKGRQRRRRRGCWQDEKERKNAIEAQWLVLCSFVKAVHNIHGLFLVKKEELRKRTRAMFAISKWLASYKFKRSKRGRNAKERLASNISEYEAT